MEKPSLAGTSRRPRERTQEEKAVDDFLEKVRRTVYIDNLSPSVTETILRNALEQFCSIVNVELLVNYLEARNASTSALVELQSKEDVDNIISLTSEHFLMVGGMPRPVRAQKAKPLMFSDRPPIAGRRITCHWVEPRDPEWNSSMRLKRLAMKHAKKADFLLKYERGEEEKLSQEQEAVLRRSYSKYELLESVSRAKTVERLATRYRRTSW